MLDHNHDRDPSTFILRQISQFVSHAHTIDTPIAKAKVEETVDLLLKIEADSREGFASLPLSGVGAIEHLAEGNRTLAEKLEFLSVVLTSEPDRSRLVDTITGASDEVTRSLFNKLHSSLEFDLSAPESTLAFQGVSHEPVAEPNIAATFEFVDQTLIEGGKQRLVAPTHFESAYTVIGMLGQGGMGSVLRVLNNKLGREEAAKFIQPRVGESESNQRTKLSRFHEEIRISSQLSPAGFVQTYDVFVTNARQVGFTMELIEGGINLEKVISAFTSVVNSVTGDADASQRVDSHGTKQSSENSRADIALLQQVLRIRPHHEEYSLSEKRDLTKAVVDLLIHVCRNLQIMHDLGYIHRDIKPANILIDNQGRVRLADAGLAEEIVKLVSRPLGISGTAQYMAPEQAIGNPVGEGVHTDIYAVGAMLYQIITGRTQVVVKRDEEFTVRLLDPIRSGDIPKPHRTGRSLFGFSDLEAICNKSMSTKPSDRYASAAELADDLTRWVRGGEVHAYKESAPRIPRLLYGMRSYILDHALRVTGVCGAAMAAVLGGIYSFGALSARSKFDKLTAQAQKIYLKHNAGAISSSLELHRQADTVLAPYAAGLALVGLSDHHNNQVIRQQLEVELIDRNRDLSAFQSFTQDASTALRAASSDFSTYRGVDSSIVLLEDVLLRLTKDVYSPDAATEILLKAQAMELTDDERRELLVLAAQCFEACAFKLPFHPELGLKYSTDADRGLALLRNTRRLYEEVAQPLSTTEIGLELRFHYDRLKVAEGRSLLKGFQKQGESHMLSNSSTPVATAIPILRVVRELEEKRAHMSPVSARDFYMEGKATFFDQADDELALKHFNQAIALAESTAAPQQGMLNPAVIFGAYYGKGLALLKLRRSEEANTAFSDARRAIQGLEIKPSQENNLFGLVTSKIAQTYEQSFYRLNQGKFTDEQIETISRLYEQAKQASPGNIAVLHSYGFFLSNREQFELADSVFSELINTNPDYDYALVQRAYVRAQRGAMTDAVNDLLSAAVSTYPNKDSIGTESTISQLKNVIEHNRELILEDENLHKIWVYATTLAVCGNLTASADGTEAAEEYYTLSLTVMNLAVDWIEKRQGYGKNIAQPFSLFRELRECHPQEFGAVFERLKSFGTPPPFRGSY